MNDDDGYARWLRANPEPARDTKMGVEDGVEEDLIFRNLLAKTTT
jgi:hypothetical protein